MWYRELSRLVPSLSSDLCRLVPSLSSDLSRLVPSLSSTVTSLVPSLSSTVTSLVPSPLLSRHLSPLSLYLPCLFQGLSVCVRARMFSCAPKLVLIALADVWWVWRICPRSHVCSYDCVDSFGGSVLARMCACYTV